MTIVLFLIQILLKIIRIVKGMNRLCEIFEAILIASGFPNITKYGALRNQPNIRLRLSKIEKNKIKKNSNIAISLK